MKDHRSPWQSMWFSPRKTIEFIIQSNPKRAFWRLATLYGFMMIINSKVDEGLFIVLGMLLAPFWGYLMISLWSAILLWVGKLFDGQANFQQMRAAVAWSALPLSGIALLFLVWFFYAFLDRLITQQIPESCPEWLASFVFLGSAIWSFVLLMITLSEVQSYSILRSLATICLGVGVSSVPFLLSIILFT